VLRISSLAGMAEKVTLIREGDNHRKFGVIIDGFVEVSTNGRVICRLGSSEVVGEMAFLHPSDCLRHATVVTLEPTLFLEINSAALELSSDEVRERFNKVLLRRCSPPARSQQGARQAGTDRRPGQLSASSLGLTPAAAIAVKRRHGLCPAPTCKPLADS
jgi:CRP-like cAMP-binding protein